METVKHIYHNLFPHIGIADWFYALLGLIAHATLKLKNIDRSKFSLSILFEDFLIVWFSSFITIAICFGSLPQVLKDFSPLDAVLIGYSSSSIFKQLFKDRLSKLGLNVEAEEERKPKEEPPNKP